MVSIEMLPICMNISIEPGTMGMAMVKPRSMLQ